MSQVAKTTDKIAVAKRIDEIAGGAMQLFTQAGSFEQELAVAAAISDLRAILTPEIMQPVMALMNTDLGFQTDKDPRKAKPGHTVTPYSVDVVRECFIEARLRGFHTIGNEFNIISARFYGTQNGFVRKVKNFPGVADVKESYDVPRLMGDKGAIVKCRASWIRDGKADQIEREFAIKVNEFMGADAILGKARRKLFKAIHDQLTGQSTPEGEVNDDAVEVGGKAEPADNILNRAAASQAQAQAQTQKQDPPKEAQQQPNGTQAKELSPQESLAAVITAEAHTFEDFRRWYRDTGQEPAVADSWADFDKVPTEVANRLFKARSGLLRGLKLMGAAR